MIEVVGNIWDYHRDGWWIVVTTNGFVKKNGECVMGAGIAKQAVKRYPDLPLRLGAAIRKESNVVFPFRGERVLTFPVKHNWWERADLDLIEESAYQLATHAPFWCGEDARVALVRPGCGNGQLDWEDVREVIAPVLRTDRYVVVDDGSGDKAKQYHAKCKVR